MDKKSYILQLLKYFIMAVIVGIIVGAIDALFGRVLIAISDFRTIHYQYLLDRDMVDAFIRRKCRKRRGCCPDWSDIISCNRKKIQIPREWKINVSDRYGRRIRRYVSDPTKCNFFCH